MRRWLLMTFPLSMLGGLAATIAMAWLSAATAPPRQPVAFSLERLDEMRTLRMGAWRGLAFERFTRCTITERPDERGSGATLLEIEAEQELRAGWPMLALRCTNDQAIDVPAGLGPALRVRSGPHGLRGGIALRDGIDHLGRPLWRALPLQPMWLGFAVNAAALGAAALVMISGVSRVGRSLRRHGNVGSSGGYHQRSNERADHRA